MKVTFDYTAEQQDELGLTTGQFIRIIQKIEGGWWEGQIEGTKDKGWFPDNFVETLADTRELVKVTCAYTAERQGELGLTVGQFVRILTKEAGDDGWWKPLERETRLP